MGKRKSSRSSMLKRKSSRSSMLKRKSSRSSMLKRNTRKNNKLSKRTYRKRSKRTYRKRSKRTHKGGSGLQTGLYAVQDAAAAVPGWMKEQWDATQDAQRKGIEAQKKFEILNRNRNWRELNQRINNARLTFPREPAQEQEWKKELAQMEPNVLREHAAAHAADPDGSLRRQAMQGSPEIEAAILRDKLDNPDDYRLAQLAAKMISEDLTPGEQSELDSILLRKAQKKEKDTALKNKKIKVVAERNKDVPVPQQPQIAGPVGQRDPGEVDPYDKYDHMNLGDLMAAAAALGVDSEKLEDAAAHEKDPADEIIALIIDLMGDRELAEEAAQKATEASAADSEELAAEAAATAIRALRTDLGELLVSKLVSIVNELNLSKEAKNKSDMIEIIVKHDDEEAVRTLMA